MIKVHLYPQLDALSIFVDGVESVQRFQELIQRGAQTFADASAEIKICADEITNGKAMQDYSNMSGEKK
jgi:hypothetical protein